MGFYPINLHLEGKKVVIIGGGEVATRKCLALVQAGANVTIIAPAVCQELVELAQSHHLTITTKKFAGSEDISGALLVFAATDDHAVNVSVSQAAASLAILHERADLAADGDFSTPATFRQGDLLITVSTSGASPVLASSLRDKLSKEFGEEFREVLAIHRAVREKLLTVENNNAYNRKLLKQLADAPLADLVKYHATAEIDRLLLAIFGPGFTLAEIGVGDKDSA
jgi:precorrin-2 dehydrogenase/sirohydrochlorin ferrochelatase